MAKKDKMYMPTGSGGLVRYQEEGDEKIKLKPKHVVYVVVGLVVAEIILKLLAVA
jgi:preprotein translocase subunit Sec61beta